MKKDNLHINKKTGFKTPEQYFESFETQLNELIKLEETVCDIQQTGYTVPKNYFNSVEDSIMNNLSQREDKTPVINVNFKRSLYYISGIAASLVLLFAIFIGNEESSEISIDMVETYFETQDINSYELAELLVDAELIDDNFTITDNTYDETNLETYLLDNADIDVFIE